MKILLIGEYSNVHATLAKGLKKRGHQVTVVSNGDFWKNYPRNINLVRRPGKLGGICYMARLYSLLPRLRGYDIVQLINPMFLELKAERIFPVYEYLRKHNRKIVLDAFGMDYYWVKTCTEDKPLRYSDFNMGTELRTNIDALKERKDWMDNLPAKARLNKMIAEDCDGIVAGLYEYWICYTRAFPEKTAFIPFPVIPKNVMPKPIGEKVKLFIGINKSRSEYKGTDIMLRAAQDVVSQYAGLTKLIIAENLPFKEYVKMMNDSDILLDQLYSYTPAMNALEAMSRGIVCVGGGEAENYQILEEAYLRPIVNVEPSYESVYQQLERLVLHPEHILEQKKQSIEYIRKHHDYEKVARRYEQYYRQLLQ